MPAAARVDNWYNAWVLTLFPWGHVSSVLPMVYFIARVLIYATPGCLPVNPPLQRLRQESGQVEAILDYKAPAQSKRLLKFLVLIMY